MTCGVLAVFDASTTYVVPYAHHGGIIPLHTVTYALPTVELAVLLISS